MKIFNIIGWTVVIGLFLAAPLIDTLRIYSIALVGLMIMPVITLATVYDDIDEEIIDEWKSK